VLLIGLELIDSKGMRGIARVRGGEFVVAVLTAATVVFVGIEQAIVLAIALSLVEHLYHAYRPLDTTLAIAPSGRLQFQPLSSGSILQARAGLVIYRFGAGLYYANSTRFTEEAMAILESVDGLEWFCLSGAAIDDVDYSGAGAIREVISEAKGRGVHVVVCEVEPSVVIRQNLYGMQAEVDDAFESVDEVIAAYDRRATVETPPTEGSSPAQAQLTPG
jgi:sulfate permease, SulP family